MPPGNFYAHRDRELTGKTRYRSAWERVGWFQYQPVLVLQVQENFTEVRLPTNEGRRLSRWRDAVVGDLPLPQVTKPTACPED